MLNMWKHPKTGEQRLYLSDDVVGQALGTRGEPWGVKQTKAWIEPDGESWRIKVHIRSEDAIPKASIQSFKATLVDIAEIGGTPTWSELAQRAHVRSDHNNHCKSEAPANTPDEPEFDTVSVAYDEDAAGDYATNKARIRETKVINLEKVAIPQGLTIEIDQGETDLIASLIDEHPSVEVVRTKLETSDIRIKDPMGNEMLIDRLRCVRANGESELHYEMQREGRLFQRSERLSFVSQNSDHQIIPIMLMEGNVYAKAPELFVKQIDGAIAVLCAVDRISVLSTYTAQHSAYLIVKLASRFVRGDYQPPQRREHKPNVLFEQKRFVLESIPGISTVLAENLIERFGSIKKIANAKESELLKVKGLGRRKAHSIMHVLGSI